MKGSESENAAIVDIDQVHQDMITAIRHFIVPERRNEPIGIERSGGQTAYYLNHWEIAYTDDTKTGMPETLWIRGKHSAIGEYSVKNTDEERVVKGNDAFPVTWRDGLLSLMLDRKLLRAPK